jgi:hypothetical protein
MSRRRKAPAATPEPTPAPTPPPLRLEYLDPASLTDNPANWRLHPPAQTDALDQVLKSVGWAGACLFNTRTNRLIDGHARKKLALDRGEKAVPVLVGDWSEEEERLILATLDPLAAQAETDAASLAALMAKVQADRPTTEQELGDLWDKLRELAAATPPAAGRGDPINPDDEWKGMPEFTHENKSAKYSFTVSIDTDEDFAEFERLVGQKIGRRKWMHFPAKKNGETLYVEHVQDEADEP